MKLILLLFFLVGCAPIIKQKEIENELTVINNRIDLLKRDVELCLDKNQELIKKSDKKIDQSELEEIKKKALEETKKNINLELKN